MTARADRKVTVVIAAARPDPDPVLCGRSAADWLLDSVQAIGPDAVRFTGGGASRARERAESRPVLAEALSDPGPGGSGSGRDRPGISVALSAASPLVQPATIKRALRALAGEAGSAAVLIRSRQAPPWWSDSPPAAAAAALVSTGLPDDCLPDDCAAWLTEPGPAEAGALRARLQRLGARVVLLEAGPAEGLRTDDPVGLQQAEVALFHRIAARWQRDGVTIEDTETTRIDATVRIGRGTRIRPLTTLAGDTTIGSGATVGPVTTLLDAQAGDGCVIRYAVCERVTIGDEANVGPFCWLRSGTRLGARTRAGSFVELADSVVGDDTQIPHLGGLLSADVGRACNIAGLSGPANFDGTGKNRITLGDHVSIGAGNIMVAPLSIGDGAYTAAGTILTEDVPSGALAIGRARQVNKEGWVARNMPGSDAATAALRSAAPNQKPEADGNAASDGKLRANGNAANGNAADQATSGRAADQAASPARAG